MSPSRPPVPRATPTKRANPATPAAVRPSSPDLTRAGEAAPTPAPWTTLPRAPGQIRTPDEPPRDASPTLAGHPDTHAAREETADARRVTAALARPAPAYPRRGAAGARTAGRSPVPTSTAATHTSESGPRPLANRTTYEVRRFRGPVRPAVVSTRSAERFAERARAARNLARRQIAYVVGGALLVLGLGYLVLFSPVFALDPAKATVTGAGTVVAVDQVTAVVTRHDGTPLPRLDVGRLRTELLQVPGVRDATVSRDWPRGLTIALVSREPVAAVPEQQAPQGATAPGFALLDQDGVQVGRTQTAPGGLPVVTVPVDNPRTLQAVLSVVRQLPPGLASAIGGVSAQTQDTITMKLRDGANVDWGSADETALKAAVLTALRASPAAAGVHTIDVSAPRMPITK